jgi:uncharacterized RDD family membrane protein YckC
MAQFLFNHQSPAGKGGVEVNEIERYVGDVLDNIQAPPRERERFESDLRAHMEEALEAGESAEEIAARMGNPIEVASEFMSNRPLDYAGFWRRLVAFAIDMGLILAVAAIPVALGIASSNQVPREPQGWDYVVGIAFIAVVVGSMLTAVSCLVLYFPILEGRFGQTLGKRLLRLRVLKETGLPIGYKEAFLRRLSLYLEIIAVDALFVLFTARRQRAFDIVSRTIVIHEAS